MSGFVHLRVHSPYSLLKGAMRLPGLLGKCKDYKMPAVAISDLSLPASGPTSAEAQDMVSSCRAIQTARNGQKANAALSSAEIDAIIQLSPDAEAFVQKAAEQQKLSARGYHRVLRCAQTITDLDHGANATQIELPAIAEALSYRQMV